MSITQSQSGASVRELELLQDVESEKRITLWIWSTPIEIADETTWIKEPVHNGNLPTADSVSGIASVLKALTCACHLSQKAVSFPVKAVTFR